jgi:glycosyltransferase involved in cell wall biosynthesis
MAVSAARARYATGGQCLIGHFGTHGSLITSMLTDAIPSIAAANPAVRFVLIGSGSEQFCSVLESVHSDLTGRVSATGRLDAGDLAAHVTACDVLLQPYPDGVTSRRTTVMAGLFAGVPVVTTRGKLTERFWQEGSPVRLANVGDTHALVRHAVQLLADPVERQRQADAGRAFYDRWFDVRHTVAALAA